MLAGLFLGTAVSAVAMPATAAVYNEKPIRWNTGAAVYSTTQDDVDEFLETGEVRNRGLSGGLSRSGWTSDEVRDGMTKSYDVDLVGVSRFLYSDEGVKFLKNATMSYFPYWTMDTFAVQALRSAIISDAADGAISSAGIMRALPTDFRLADTCGTYTGEQNVCAEGRCEEGTGQCTSLLSWYVFLPACVQANQIVDPEPEPVVAPAPMPEPIRGLW